MLRSSSNSLNDESQIPNLHTVPTWSVTWGDLAVKLIGEYGLDLDPWQQYVLNDWLARDGDHWVALTCGLSVPRQNGKNAILEARELFGAVVLGEKILHTAHEVKTAQRHFKRLLYYFGDRRNDPSAKFPELNAMVDRIRLVNGQEAVYLVNGGSIELAARSKRSGRGFTVDTLVIDEAQETDEDALEALMPTTSAAPLGNPQWIFTGTPPGPTAQGQVFERVRQEAISPTPGAVAWSEWSLMPGEDPTDPAVIRRVNPAIASGRLRMESIEGEQARLSLGGFKRERLGEWEKKQVGSSRLISAQRWLASGTLEAPEDGVRSFGVAFNLVGDRQSVAGALKHDGGVHLELVGAYEGPVEEGVRPLARWLAERWRNTAIIAISGQAGAAILSQALVELGVPQAFIHVLSGSEYFESGPMLVEALVSGAATHPIGGENDILEMSVAVSDKKLRGTSGAWGWVATTPDGDETPIEALSIAHWGAKHTKRVPGARRSRRILIAGG